MTIRDLINHLLEYHLNLDSEVLVRTKRHMFIPEIKDLDFGSESDHQNQFGNIEDEDLVIDCREE